jgi:DeoR/GlpR family transcriptional regulator of sugar metabolism
MKKLEPALTYIKENPKASIKEVCEKFMLSKQTIYNLRHHHGISKKIKKPAIVKPKLSVDERKDKMIQEMLEEIVRQESIINYLEKKLARHGVAI